MTTKTNQAPRRDGKSPTGVIDSGVIDDCLSAALHFRSLGFSCIPIEPMGKRPSVRSWVLWQEDIATERDITGWFEAKPDCNLALVMGEVSGGLACRDFDDMAAYDRWAKEHPKLAGSLPTVATRRGRHVYFQISAAAEKDLRKRLGKPESKGAVKLGDGELRVGACYSVAPPSRHAFGRYSWLIGLEHLRNVDPVAEGLVEVASTPRCDSRRDQRDQKTCLVDSLDSLVEIDRPDVAEIIERCTLREFQRRHETVFNLARELKAVPELSKSPAGAFKDVVQEWWRRSRPFMVHERSFDENWSDFLEGWDKVRWPKGQEPVLKLMHEALAGPPPPEAGQFDDPGVIELLKICSALQQTAGDEPFFIASRTAAMVMYPGRDVEIARQTVTRKLAYLCRPEIGVLEKVSQGTAANRLANRYRYLPCFELKKAS